MHCTADCTLVVNFTLFVSVFHHDINVELTRKKESNRMMMSPIVCSQIECKVVKYLLENPLLSLLSALETIQLIIKVALCTRN